MVYEKVYLFNTEIERDNFEKEVEEKILKKPVIIENDEGGIV